ncbi:MAG: hypothetical protein M3Y48_25140, partial [Actinomycetota bacterium]|nr:hypothetical protein [Actinomycetota bacterium]
MATVRPFGLTFMESVPPQSVPAPIAGAVLDQRHHIATFNGRPLCELVGLDEEMNSSSQTNTDGEDSIRLTTTGHCCTQASTGAGADSTRG